MKFQGTIHRFSEIEVGFKMWIISLGGYMSIPNMRSLPALLSILQFALDVYCSLISEGIIEASTLSYSVCGGVVAHLPSCHQKQMELRDRFLACSLCFYTSC